MLRRVLIVAGASSALGELISFFEGSFVCTWCSTTEAANKLVPLFRPSLVVFDWRVGGAAASGFAARLRSLARYTRKLIVIAIHDAGDLIDEHEMRSIDLSCARPVAVAAVSQLVTETGRSARRRPRRVRVSTKPLRARASSR